MLKDEELRVKIIWLHHNMLVKDVGKYVDKCYLYQRMKNKMEAPAGKLIVNEISERLQTYLTVNFIMKLLLVVSKNVILVVCNRLSKTAHFMATIEETLAKGLVRLFRDNVQKLHRLPENVISDRRPQFAVELTKELNRMLRIKMKLLTFFYLQTDRQTE